MDESNLATNEEEEDDYILYEQVAEYVQEFINIVDRDETSEEEY